jgi:hypothetical protein
MCAGREPVLAAANDGCPGTELSLKHSGATAEAAYADRLHGNGLICLHEIHPGAVRPALDSSGGDGRYAAVYADQEFDIDELCPAGSPSRRRCSPIRSIG